MTDEKIMNQARTIYERISSVLDSKGWTHKRRDDELVITCGARGEDIPMDFVIMVNARAQIVSVLSFFPFKTPKERITDMSVAVCFANYGLINGNFELNPLDGTIRYKNIVSFYDSVLGDGMLEYLIMVSGRTVDDFNHKFLGVAQGGISAQQFIDNEIARRNGK